jgi:hypothetical protein
VNSYLEGTSWFTPFTMAPFAPSPVSRVCALALEDYTQVRLWDPIRDQDLGRVNAHAIANFVFRADGTRIAVLERANPKRLGTGIWNIAAGRWETHLTEGGTLIAFLSDDELIVLVIPQLRWIRIATGQVAWSTLHNMWPMLVSANGRVAAPPARPQPEGRRPADLGSGHGQGNRIRTGRHAGSGSASWEFRKAKGEERNLAVEPVKLPRLKGVALVTALQQLLAPLKATYEATDNLVLIVPAR